MYYFIWQNMLRQKKLITLCKTISQDEHYITVILTLKYSEVISTNQERRHKILPVVFEIKQERESIV